MTTARERPAARRGLNWDERSLLPERVGVRWWAAICLALGLTAAGVFVDVQRLNRLGIVFQACYFLGCLLAVVLVQRKGLFGPMVQPPLILALAVPSVVLAAGSIPTDGGSTAAALAVGTPLINGFPTMAVTTGVTLAVGVLRLLTQRAPATGTTEPDDEQVDRPKRKPAPEQTRKRPPKKDPKQDADRRKPQPKPRTSRKPEPEPEPEAEPLTEPVPRVNDPAPGYETDRGNRRS
ncbi:MAG: DUF6542 domain-containing protein [Pseudonocardiaceae bacterium]